MLDDDLRIQRHVPSKLLFTPPPSLQRGKNKIGLVWKAGSVTPLANRLCFSSGEGLGNQPFFFFNIYLREPGTPDVCDADRRPLVPVLFLLFAHPRVRRKVAPLPASVRRPEKPAQR